LESGDVLGAESDLQSSLAVSDDITARLLLARCYVAKGDSAKHDALTEQLINSLLPSSSTPQINGMSWTHALDGHSKISPAPLVERMEAICKGSKQGNYWNTLALLYYRAQRYDDAIRAAQTSFKLNRAASEPIDWIIIVMSRCQRLLSARVREEKEIALISSERAKIAQWHRTEADRFNNRGHKTVRVAKIQSLELPILEKELNPLLQSLGFDDLTTLTSPPTEFQLVPTEPTDSSDPSDTGRE
jgi:tetratricopeptide (TPR) repeat protein